MSDPRPFPRVEARSLNGERFTVPDELPGTLRLLAVAFRREQQQLVDSWLGWMLDLEARTPGLRAFELPVLSLVYSPARRLIDGGMARGVGTDAARERTLTVYGDVRGVVGALGLPGTGSIAVVLVDRVGAILAQEAGGFEPIAAQRIESAINRARPSA